MKTEHILFFPHKEYDIKKEKTDNLKIKDYVNYGYIKLRDLTKWLNYEKVSVKMGMLTPSNKSYRGLTILESALKRIKEQDTTALFDDEDELIPVYVFVSEETDNEWRDYLISRGFHSTRKTANREGIKISKSGLGFYYGKHYNIDTSEVVSEREKAIKDKDKRLNSQRYADIILLIRNYYENNYNVNRLRYDLFEQFSLRFVGDKIYFGKGKYDEVYWVHTDIEDLEFEELEKILKGMEIEMELVKERRSEYLTWMIICLVSALFSGIRCFSFNLTFIGEMLLPSFFAMSIIGLFYFIYLVVTVKNN